MKIKIICFFVLTVSGINAMNYNLMYKQTKKSNNIQNVSINSMNAGGVFNEKQLRDVALNGDYVAQYALSQIAGGKARIVFNEERETLLREKAFLLLISAVRGNFWRSLEELEYNQNFEFVDKSKINFSKIEDIVDNIYETL